MNHKHISCFHFPVSASHLVPLVLSEIKVCYRLSCVREKKADRFIPFPLLFIYVFTNWTCLTLFTHSHNVIKVLWFLNKLWDIWISVWGWHLEDNLFRNYRRISTMLHYPEYFKHYPQLGCKPIKKQNKKPYLFFTKNIVI